MRIFQKSWRSASSRATRMSSEPDSSHMRSTSPKRASHSCSGPSSSTSSAAPASVGHPAWPICSDAPIERLSIISMAPGTIPADTISETTSPAWLVESKNATSVRTDSGFGTTRSQTFVATPRVPSEPTNAPSRSYPGGSSSGPPTCTISPSARTSSSPVT